LTTRESQAGAYQFIWGLVKKVVIADTCATYANAILTTIPELLVFTPRTIYFAFQIYGDFSGYSDMALGMSKLFGMDLLRNFNSVFLERYCRVLAPLAYIPVFLVSRLFIYSAWRCSKSKMKQVRNVFIIFLW
jgi:hypothetical protein